MDPIRNRLSEQLHRVEVLRNRYEHLAAELGRSDGRSDLSRIDSSMTRRENQVNHLNLRIHELNEERDVLESEILGCLAGAEALLTGLVDQLESEHGPNWSPRPLVGFSAFSIENGDLMDGDHRWNSAETFASCPDERTMPPHVHGPCRIGACGVIAWKSASSLPDTIGSSMTALAALDLTGKIVEHEHAYRAERAAVGALLVTDGSRWFRTRDRDRITEFCTGPEEAFSRYSTAIPAAAMLYIESDLYLSAARD